MLRLLPAVLLLASPAALARTVVRSYPPQVDFEELPPGEHACTARLVVGASGRPSAVDVSQCPAPVQAEVKRAVMRWRFVRGDEETLTLRFRFRGTGAAAVAAADGKVLYVPDLPSTLDPLHTASAGGRRVLALVLDPLVDPSGDPGRGATAWTHADNRLVLTPREGARFRGGAPVTAEDLCASLTAFTDPVHAAALPARVRRGITGCTVVGDAAIVEAVGIDPVDLGSAWILPASALVSRPEGGWDLPPDGTGWYTIRRDARGFRLEGEDVVHVEQLVDPLQAVKALGRGEVLGVAPATRLFSSADTAAVPHPCGAGEAWYGALTSRGVLSDVRVRLALTRVLDVERLLAGFEPSMWTPLAGPFPPHGAYEGVDVPAGREGGWRDLMLETGAEKYMWWSYGDEPVRLRVAVPELAEVEVPGFSGRLGAQLRAAGFHAEIHAYRGDWAEVDPTTFDLVLTRSPVANVPPLGGPFARDWSETVRLGAEADDGDGDAARALATRLSDEASHVFLFQLATSSVWAPGTPAILIERVCGAPVER